jgi:ribosomal protein S18 acetylase RimI-like enzyme
MTFAVRRATLADAEDAAAVFSAAFAGMTFVPKLHSDTEDGVFVRGLIADKETWVAVESGRIAGLAVHHDGWLEQLYVHPAHQGRGAGTTLLETVRRAHRQGFQLWTFQANKGARRFYERHGFRLMRLTDGSGNEERTPDALYAWP